MKTVLCSRPANAPPGVDATSAAGFIYNPDESQVSDTTGFFQAPKQVTDKGTGWFWAWALAIPASSKKADAAKEFLAWSTSKDYVRTGRRDQRLGRGTSGDP